MTIAANDQPQADHVAGPAVADMPVLLPTREDLLERLAAELATSGEQPTTLLVIELLRRDDGWPTPTSPWPGCPSRPGTASRSDHCIRGRWPAS